MRVPDDGRQTTDDRSIFHPSSVFCRLSSVGALGFLLILGGAALAATPEDTIVMGKAIDEMISLDPAEVYESAGGEVAGNLYDRLIALDPATPGRFRPRLAQSWEIDVDRRHYRFTLRRDARFADGAPVTAADAAFSLQRAVILRKAPALVLQQLGLDKDNVADRVRAEEDGTLLVVTARPLAPSLVLACLTSIVASVVEKSVVLAHAEEGDLGNLWLALHSAGSGPYRLRIWRPAEHYALDANPGYWDGAPRNARIIVRHIKEASTQRLMLERHDIDYARDLDKDALAALAGRRDIRIDQGVQSLITYLALNQRNPYLRRPEVIEAMKYLVDYDGMATSVLGPARIVHQGFEPVNFLGAGDETPFHYDPARAKALLASAGLGDGFDVALDVRNAWPSMDMAVALQASFAAAGIRLAIIPADGKQVLTKYRARHHDLFLGEWGPDYPDPHSNAEAFIDNPDSSDAAAKKTPAWRNAWSDPPLAARVAAAMLEEDRARRAELYLALQHDHRQVAPFVFMYEHVEIAAHRSDVDGFVIGPTAGLTRYAGITKR
jgi:peptide/nickel transport system substrate-binding protein